MINKLFKIKELTVATILLIFHFCNAYGQDSIVDAKKRYTFAQSTFGYDIEYIPKTGSSYFKNANNTLEKTKFGNIISPTFSITGLHFWGHAEFFTGFTFKTINLNSSANKIEYNRSSATGAKIFPWSVNKHTLVPYLGFSVSSFSFKQDQGVELNRIEYPLLFGLTYRFKKGMLEIGGNYHPKAEYSYYISRNEKNVISVPQITFSIDYKYFFDLTLSSLKRIENGELKQEFDLLKSKKSLSSFYIALGPAYSFFTQNSSYNTANRPYLDNYNISNLYPDMGLGYYNYKLDACLNLSWRNFKTSLSAYNVSQHVHRNSIAIEFYKFIGDYHGFVPFVGGIISNENFEVTENDASSKTLNEKFSFFTGGLIIGWDIRSTRTDWWGVRTNIRYFPGLNLTLNNGYNINMNQIELNFLQLILYPNRIATYLKYKK